MKRKSPPPGGFFPSLEPNANQARTVEWNKSRRESRTIQTGAIQPEDIGFPLAAQAAQRRRQTKGRKDELVCLVTNLEPAQRSPRQWLDYNRLAWGIENGLHQRLDIWLRDDECRVRTPRSMHLLGMLRRLSNSLLMHWRSLQPRPEYKTISDFHTFMEEDNLRRAFRFATSKRPTFKQPS